LAGAVSEADDRERRQAPLEVCLHLHPASIEADKSMCDRPCKHVVTIGNDVALNRNRNVSKAKNR
jgi:hypothetical protein